MNRAMLAGNAPALPNAATFADAYLRLYELRAAIERTLHEMVELLDAIDPDPDLEPTMGDVENSRLDKHESDDDEPSLGWTAVEAQHGRYRGDHVIHGSDLEAEHDG